MGKWVGGNYYTDAEVVEREIERLEKQKDDMEAKVQNILNWAVKNLTPDQAEEITEVAYPENRSGEV